VEVINGLSAGEQLISEGFLMLRPGSPVTPQES
jgi:membrane fusion protein (multidrug efflux system)